MKQLEGTYHLPSISLQTLLTIPTLVFAVMYSHAVTAIFLGLVHRGIGPPKKRFLAVVIAVDLHLTDAGGTVMFYRQFLFPIVTNCQK